jgi:hypothetical protein
MIVAVGHVDAATIAHLVMVAVETTVPVDVAVDRKVLDLSDLNVGNRATDLSD